MPEERLDRLDIIFINRVPASVDEVISLFREKPWGMKIVVWKNDSNPGQSYIF